MTVLEKSAECLFEVYTVYSVHGFVYQDRVMMQLLTMATWKLGLEGLIHRPRVWLCLTCQFGARVSINERGRSVSTAIYSFNLESQQAVYSDCRSQLSTLIHVRYRSRWAVSTMNSSECSRLCSLTGWSEYFNKCYPDGATIQPCLKPRRGNGKDILLYNSVQMWLVLGRGYHPPTPCNGQFWVN